MENKKVIKLTYDYFHKDKVYSPHGRLGSFIIHPEFPSKLWAILYDGELDWRRDIIEELLGALKEEKGSPPYTLEDFTSQEVMDIVSEYYSWESMDMGAHLEVKGEMIDPYTIKENNIYEINIPKELEIEGISNFDLLLTYIDI